MKEEQKPFVLQEKIEEMVNYGYNEVRKFPEREKKLKDHLDNAMLNMIKLVVQIKNNPRIKERRDFAIMLDSELAVLRAFVRFSHNADNYADKNIHPPLTAEKYDFWTAKLDEIGKLLGGLIKGLNSSMSKA